VLLLKLLFEADPFDGGVFWAVVGGGAEGFRQEAHGHEGALVLNEGRRVHGLADAVLRKAARADEHGDCLRANYGSGRSGKVDSKGAADKGSGGSGYLNVNPFTKNPQKDHSSVRKGLLHWFYAEVFAYFSSKMIVYFCMSRHRGTLV